MTKGMTRYIRVAARLREEYQDKPFELTALEDAIFVECGTDPRTLKVGIANMIRLKLVTELDKIKVFGVHPKRRFMLLHNNEKLY